MLAHTEASSAPTVKGVSKRQPPFWQANHPDPQHPLTHTQRILPHTHTHIEDFSGTLWRKRIKKCITINKLEIILNISTENWISENFKSENFKILKIVCLGIFLYSLFPIVYEMYFEGGKGGGSASRICHITMNVNRTRICRQQRTQCTMTSACIFVSMGCIRLALKKMHIALRWRTPTTSIWFGAASQSLSAISVSASASVCASVSV